MNISSARILPFPSRTVKCPNIIKPLMEPRGKHKEQTPTPPGLVGLDSPYRQQGFPICFHSFAGNRCRERFLDKSRNPAASRRMTGLGMTGSEKMQARLRALPRGFTFFWQSDSDNDIVR